MKGNNVNIHRMKKFIGALLFISAFILNISMFKIKPLSNPELLNSLLLQASAQSESDPPSEGSGPTLKWSAPIACDGTNNGYYRVCNSNGGGNDCSPAGAITCSCGTNCT